MGARFFFAISEQLTQLFPDQADWVKDNADLLTTIGLALIIALLFFLYFKQTKKK